MGPRSAILASLAKSLIPVKVQRPFLFYLKLSMTEAARIAARIALLIVPR